MAKKHEELKAAALEAISDLFGDTSVGNLVTRDSLVELSEDIEAKIEAIDADIEGEE